MRAAAFATGTTTAWPPIRCPPTTPSISTRARRTTAPRRSASSSRCGCDKPIGARMNWIAGSIRNKILAVFVLGIALVVAGALYGFAAARNGLATVARVNDTLIAQAIQAQALEATFKDQVQQWMSA